MRKTQKTQYRVTDRHLVTQEGVLSSSENQIEWIRLKDISTSQDLLQGIVGVGDIHLVTSDQTDPRKTLNSIPIHQDLKQRI